MELGVKPTEALPADAVTSPVPGSISMFVDDAFFPETVKVLVTTIVPAPVAMPIVCLPLNDVPGPLTFLNVTWIGGGLPPTKTPPCKPRGSLLFRESSFVNT
jgi:hypothetical protein